MGIETKKDTHRGELETGINAQRITELQTNKQNTSKMYSLMKSTDER